MASSNQEQLKEEMLHEVPKKWRAHNLPLIASSSIKYSNN
jgi:hypothetical protein